jgi:hypothetical protein
MVLFYKDIIEEGNIYKNKDKLLENIKTDKMSLNLNNILQKILMESVNQNEVID